MKLQISIVAIFISLVGYVFPASADDSKCAKVGTIILAAFQPVLDAGENEEAVVKENRAKVHAAFQACVDEFAAVAKRHEKSWPERAPTDFQVAKGIETIFEGAKILCPNRVSQGSAAQEFACYRKIYDGLWEVLVN